MNFFWQTDRGLVKIVILILIALLILGYFGLNIRSIASSPTFQDNWHYIRDLALNIWNNYLKKPATYLWNIFFNLIWTPAIDNLEKMKNDQPNDIQSSAPRIPEPSRALVQ